MLRRPIAAPATSATRPPPCSIARGVSAPGPRALHRLDCLPDKLWHSLQRYFPFYLIVEEYTISSHLSLTSKEMRGKKESIRKILARGKAAIKSNDEKIQKLEEEVCNHKSFCCSCCDDFLLCT